MYHECLVGETNPLVSVNLSEKLADDVLKEN